MCWGKLNARRTRDPSGITALLQYLPALNQSRDKGWDFCQSKGLGGKIQLHTYGSLSGLHVKTTFTVLIL